MAISVKYVVLSNAVVSVKSFCFWICLCVAKTNNDFEKKYNLNQR